MQINQLNAISNDSMILLFTQNKNKVESTRLVSSENQVLPEKANKVLDFSYVNISSIEPPLEKSNSLLNSPNSDIRTYERIKEPSQKKIDAINIIFKEFCTICPNLSFEEMQNVKQEISLNVFSISKMKRSCAFEINKELFIVAKGFRQHVKMLEVIKKTDLIIDSYMSEIYAAKDLHTMKESFVLKIAVNNITVSDDSNAGIKQMMNEISTLNQVNSEGKFARLQSAPLVTFEYIATETKDKKIGYITERFDGDCFSLFTDNLLTLEEKLKIHNQILEIWGDLEIIQLCHRDLKIDNFLYKKNENGEINLQLIDFGFTTLYHKLLYINEKFNPLALKSIIGGSPAYNSQKLCLQLQTLIENLTSAYSLAKKLASTRKDENLKNQMLEDLDVQFEIEYQTQIKPLIEKNEKFALGLVLYILWVGDFPPFFSFTENGLNMHQLTDATPQKRSQMAKLLKEKDAPKEAIDFIFAALEMPSRAEDIIITRSSSELKQKKSRQSSL